MRSFGEVEGHEVGQEIVEFVVGLSERGEDFIEGIRVGDGVGAAADIGGLADDGVGEFGDF